MNKLKGSVLVKLLAALLLVAMLGAFVFAACGVVLLNEYGAYPNNYKAATEAVLDNYGMERLYRAQQDYAYDQIAPEDIFPDSAFCFVIKDDNGKTLYDGLKNRKTQWKSDAMPFYYSYAETTLYMVGDAEYSDDYSVSVNRSDASDEARKYSITGYLLADVPAGDDMELALSALNIAFNMRYAIIGVAAGSIILALLLFVFLMSAAGHRGGTEEIRGSFLEKIPFDVFTALVVLVEVCLIALCSEVGYNINGVVVQLFVLCFVVGAGVLVAILWCMSWAVRIKLHTALRGCLCYKVLSWAWGLVKKLFSAVKELVRGLPLIPRAGVIIGGILLVEFIFICSANGTGGHLFGWFLERLVLVGVTLYTLLCMRKLLKAGKEIASGNMSYTVDTARMYGPLKEHGEDLNSITDGLNRAVSERMKSEHFKTELITNVSHDIKTPLTSIINYVDLMEKEEPESENMREYLEVLSRQSARLKKLIDDLMDASKASTGNLTVNLEKCELGVLLDQCAGEYGEKLLAKDLELIVSKPEQSVVIMADGRHMWRILDNLLGNVSKYAQKGTRVYLTLQRQENKAVITLKNVSASMLNVSADELMERFVRGDSSRSTEGSGLGLNIARSLVQLQKGSMELAVDGDLFKVTLTFDAVQE